MYNTNRYSFSSDFALRFMTGTVHSTTLNTTHSMLVVWVINTAWTLLVTMVTWAMPCILMSLLTLIMMVNNSPPLTKTTMDHRLLTVQRYLLEVFGTMTVISATQQGHTVGKGRITQNVWYGGRMVKDCSFRILSGVSERIIGRMISILHMDKLYIISQLLRYNCSYCIYSPIKQPRGYF